MLNAASPSSCLGLVMMLLLEFHAGYACVTLCGWEFRVSKSGFGTNFITISQMLGHCFHTQHCISTSFSALDMTLLPEFHAGYASVTLCSWELRVFNPNVISHILSKCFNAWHCSSTLLCSHGHDAMLEFHTGYAYVTLCGRETTVFKLGSQAGTNSNTISYMSDHYFHAQHCISSLKSRSGHDSIIAWVPWLAMHVWPCVVEELKFSN